MATTSDLPDLQDLFAEYCIETKQIPSKVFPNMLAGLIEARRMWVLCKDNGIQGFVDVHPYLDIVEPTERVAVTALYVRSSYRKSAFLLMHQIDRLMKEWKIPTVDMRTHVPNIMWQFQVRGWKRHSIILRKVYDDGWSS